MSPRALDLEAMLVLVEPAVPVVPDACQPWAWYTPESLQDDGSGNVAVWGDVTGRGRDMAFGGFNVPSILGTNVIDGNSALVSPDGEAGGYWSDSVDVPQTFEGVTLMMVVNPESTAGPQTAIWQLWVDYVIGWLELGDSDWGSQSISTDVGFADGQDVRMFGPHAFIFWDLSDGSQVTFEVNGQPWNPGPEGGEYPNGSPWSFNTSSFGEDLILLPPRPNAPGAWCSEIIVFNCDLTPGQRAQWWGYLAGKYPSLGIG